MTRVAVFGASGVQGAAQVVALVQAGHEPVAISRAPKPLRIGGMDVMTAAADFSDDAAIKSALKKSAVVFLNLPSTSFQPAEPVIAGARVIANAIKATTSVKLVIFNTSMPVPETKRGIKAQDDRVEIRDILRETGLPVVSIQPVVFLDNLLEGWAYPPIAERQTIVYCHKPELEVSWICHRDLGQLMIAAMDKPGLAGRNIPVGGPETVRLCDLAEKLSRAWERPIKYDNQTVEDFCDKISGAMRQRAGLNADRIVQQMREAYTHYNESPDEPFKIDMDAVLADLPARLTTIEEWGRRNKNRLPPAKE